jgi:predicted transcriptional regulator
MKERKEAYKPTEAELEILRCLWEEGPSTVRTVNDRLNKKRKVGYTTTLKIMQIMSEKGLVTRELDGRTHIYAAALSEMETQRRLVDRLLETAFGGSAKSMMMQLLGNHRSSKEELEEIRKLIDKIESKKS